MAEPKRLEVVLNDKRFDVELLSRTHDEVRFVVEGRSYHVRLEQRVEQTAKPGANPGGKSTARKNTAVNSSSGAQVIQSPIPGLVAEVLVKVGDHIEAQDTVMRIEAMKMQNSIQAPCNGQIVAVHVSAGQEVADAQPLLEIVPDKISN